MISHPLCFSRWILRSIRCGANVSGHEMREVFEGQHASVQLLKCDTCGEYAVGWEPVDNCAEKTK